MKVLYQAMTSLCAHREYCCADIAEKLRRKGATPEQTAVLIDRLIEEGYIDEGRYARAFVHDKILYNGWGRIKVAQHLRAKGICPAYIQEAMPCITEEQYAEVFQKVLRSKQRSIKGETDYEVRQKLARSLIARGFEPSYVFENMDLEYVEE
jgi:regulatory protein